jgi:hypothetical protein
MEYACWKEPAVLAGNRLLGGIRHARRIHMRIDIRLLEGTSLLDGSRTILEGARMAEAALEFTKCCMDQLAGRVRRNPMF